MVRSRGWLLVVLLAIVLVLVSFGKIEKGTLKIVNESGEVIANVSARVSRSVFNTGRLDHGQSKFFQFDVPGDSSYDLDIKFASGRHHQITNMGYLDCFEQTDTAVIKATTVELITETHLPFYKPDRRESHNYTTVYSMAEHRYWPALQKPQSASPESK